jgi:hypothetical protein
MSRRVSPVVLLALVSCFGLASCDQKGTKNQISSDLFFAPVPLDVNPATGRNPATGERRVEALVTRSQILRAINPGQIGENPQASPATFVLGRLSATELVLYESSSKTLLKADLDRSPVLDPANTIVNAELIQEFSNPNISLQAETSVSVLDGVVVSYEASSRTLFAIEADDDGVLDIIILANSNDIRRQIGTQTFNFASAFELPRNPVQPQEVSELLLVSSLTTQDPQLFIVRRGADGSLTGRFRVFDAEGEPFPDEVPIGAEAFGYLPLQSIRLLTDSQEASIFTFTPQILPDTQSFLLYEQDSSTFLQVDVQRDGSGEVIGNVLGTFASGAVVRNVVLRNEVFEVPLDFQTSVAVPDDERIVAFEEETNTMLSLDYSNPSVPGALVSIYATSDSLSQRIDEQGGTDIEFGLQEPVLEFSSGLLRDNLVLFDAGNDQILSLSESSRLYVVVIKQGDIAAATGLSGISDIRFMETLNNNELLAFDTAGNALMVLRVDYAAFPVR